MKVEDKKSMLEDIKAKKRQLLVMRIKLSSGESVVLKEIKQIRKDIARLFTKLNSMKKSA